MMSKLPTQKDKNTDIEAMVDTVVDTEDSGVMGVQSPMMSKLPIQKDRNIAMEAMVDTMVDTEDLADMGVMVVQSPTMSKLPIQKDRNIAMEAMVDTVVDMADIMVKTINTINLDWNGIRFGMVLICYPLYYSFLFVVVE